MKKSILYRAIPCLVALIICVAVIVPVVPSVSASEEYLFYEVYSFDDFDTSVTYDETNKIITCKIPYSQCSTWDRYNYGGYRVTNGIDDNGYRYVSIDLNDKNPGGYIEVCNGPFVHQMELFDTGSLPAGTVLDIECSFSYSLNDTSGDRPFAFPVDYYTPGDVYFQFGGQLAYAPLSAVYDSGSWTVNQSVTLNPGQEYITFYSCHWFYLNENVTITFTDYSCTFSFTVDQMQEMIESQGEINDTLKLILAELIDQGENLDEIALLLAEISAKLDNMQCDHSGIEALLSSIDEKLTSQGSSLEDILTGGEAGDSLGEAGDRLEDVGGDLGGAMDDMNDLKDQLPTMAPNLDQEIDQNLQVFESSGISNMMPWNDPNYVEFWTALTMPTISSLTVALLLYFVFGKAKG